MVSRISHSSTTDGWKEANHSLLMASSGQVDSISRRQFILLETKGNQIPTVLFNGPWPSGRSKSDGETNHNNVVKSTSTEKIVEYTSTVPAAPFINKYRLPPWDQDQYSNSRDFGVDDEDHRHSRRHPAGPDSDVNDHHDPHNNFADEKFEGFINRVRDEAQRPGTTTTTNKPAVVALPLTSAWRSVPPHNPRNNNYVQENNINTATCECPNNNNNKARSGQSLSKPTNQISTAMDQLLKEAMKPFNEEEKEIIGLINSSSAYRGSRPAAVAKSSTSDPYSHQVMTAAAGKKKGPAAPETIDSMEASRRYGKLSSRTIGEEEYKNQKTITSKQALEKYKGAFVPPGVIKN